MYSALEGELLTMAEQAKAGNGEVRVPDAAQQAQVRVIAQYIKDLSF